VNHKTFDLDFAFLSNYDQELSLSFPDWGSIGVLKRFGAIWWWCTWIPWVWI